MNALTIHVERIVRSIRASERRKDRMREELLAHLTTAYGQETDKGCDADEAVRRAIERFGDPDGVRAELQASVPVLERIFCMPVPLSSGVDKVCERLLSAKVGEKAWRHAARIALWVALSYAVLDLLAICMGFAREAGVIGKPKTFPLLGILKVIVGVHGGIVGCAFILVLCSHAMQRALDRSRTRLGRVTMVAGWSVASTVVAAGGLAWARWWVSPLIDCSTAGMASVAGIVLMATPLLFLYVSLVSRNDRRRRETWGSLKI